MDEAKKQAFLERMALARERRKNGELPPKKSVATGRPPDPLKKKKKKVVKKAPKKSPIEKPVKKVKKKVVKKVEKPSTIPVEQNLIKNDKEPTPQTIIIRQQPLSLAEKKKLYARADFLEKLKERAVALRSFEYFLDKFVYIEDKEQNRAIKLDLWPAQREILPKLVESNLLELLKTRQVGLTWLCAALVLWLAMKHELHLSIIISASEDHAKEFLDRVYFILDRLPEWMIPPVTTRTVLTLEFTRNKLKSTIKSMPTIEMGAESKTPNLLVIDEAHVIRAVSSIFNSSYPGIEQAKGRVIIIANSVKNGPGWPWVRDNYIKSMQGIGLFERIFLSWTAHPGRPPDFRERMVASGMAEDDVIEHYPFSEVEALQSAFGSFFGKALGRHNQFKQGEEGFLLRGETDLKWISEKRGSIEVWGHPNTNYKGRYAIGSDVSEGLSGDFSVAYVLDRIEDKMVARMRTNKVDADKWGYDLKDLSDYYGQATVCCERNGSGITTIKRLEDLYVPQYVRMLAGKTGGTMQKVFGWGSTTASKWEMCGDLKTWLFNTEEEVPCGILIDECSTFIREGGRLGSEEGRFDDCVIAMGMTLQANAFMREVTEIPRPEKEPTGDTLARVAFLDRKECLEAEMAETNEDYEW